MAQMQIDLHQGNPVQVIYMMRRGEKERKIC
jgi:hypothetical protein